MRLFRLSLGLFVISVSNALAGQVLEGYSEVQGKGYAFEIKAPRSWVLDNDAAKAQGLNVVLYPTGNNWQESRAVIYVRVRSIGPTIQNTPDQVSDTLRNLRESGSPNVKAKHVRTLTTQDASKAEIYYYTGDQFGNFEAAAYIQAKGSIQFITLSTRDEDAFKQAISAFDSVVASYEDLTKPPSEGSQP
ncbi:MAG TPA: hypothetical protein VE154_02640 [Chthoniobacterales bacterium]|nr:hypothetical protein [Chthoniobacterales bacterium]